MVAGQLPSLRAKMVQMQLRRAPQTAEDAAVGAVGSSLLASDVVAFEPAAASTFV